MKNTDIIGEDIIGQDGQNLTYQELDLLVSLADGQTPSQISKRLNISGQELQKKESLIRAKLGAKSKPHMIARAFVLGVLIPRAFCLLLIMSSAAPMFSRDMPARPHRPAPRTTRQITRIVRISRSGGGRQYT